LFTFIIDQFILTLFTILDKSYIILINFNNCIQDNRQLILFLNLFFEIKIQIVQYNNAKICEKDTIDRSQLQLLLTNKLFKFTC